MILGILLIFIGALYLLKNLGLVVLPTSFWSLLYPLIVIVLGIHFVNWALRGRKYKDAFVDRYLRRRKNVDNPDIDD